MSFLYGQMPVNKFDLVSINEMSYQTTARVGCINSAVAMQLTL